MGLLSRLLGTADGGDDLVADLLEAYRGEAEHAARLRQHATTHATRRWRETLRRLADLEDRHAGWLRDRILALGGGVPPVAPPHPVARNQWERAVAAREEAQQKRRRLVELDHTVGPRAPEDGGAAPARRARGHRSARRIRGPRHALRSARARLSRRLSPSRATGTPRGCPSARAAPSPPRRAPAAPALGRAPHPRDRRGAHRRIAHHAALPHLPASRLELRLHQRDDRRRRRAARAATAGSTSASEMNDTSTVTRSGASGSIAASRWRTLVRSSTTTRGILAQRPGELAVADVDRDHARAPRRSRQSVKPPVDAPTSSATAPATSMPNASSAPASFSPPRLT